MAKKVTALFFLLILAIVCSLTTVHADEVSNQPPNAHESTNQTADIVNAPSPEEIEKLLRQKYKVIDANPSSLNPFPRLVPHGSDAGVLSQLDSIYHVIKVTNFDDKGFFKQQRILVVTVTNIILEARTMIANRSKGIFALDGTNLQYLNGADSSVNVTAVLRRENRPLEEMDAKTFSEFLTQTILRQGNDRILIMQTVDDIMKMNMTNANEKNKRLGKNSLRYYPTVNKSELEKCKDQIVKPELSGNRKSGWKCHFVGVRGWMYKVSLPFTLIAFDIDISPTFDFKINQTLLSKDIMN